MAEGIALPALTARTPREELLPSHERLARLVLARPQIEAACHGETDAIALQATLACLLFQTLAQANFCGFYRRTGPFTLTVGPYQGSMGCTRIDFSRGVCGKCARTREVQLVRDVHAVEDHISCDERSRAELVIPIVARGELRAVFDVDSPYVDAFSKDEATLLAELMNNLFDRADVVF